MVAEGDTEMGTLGIYEPQAWCACVWKGWSRETEGGRRNEEARILRQVLESPEGIRGETPGWTDTQLFPDMLSAPNGTCKVICSLRCSQGLTRTSSNQIVLLSCCKPCPGLPVDLG